MAAQEVFLGRQPIVDRNMEVAAYELLYRSGDTDRATFVDGDTATSSVLVRSITEFGLDQIAGNLPVFVNFTDRFICGELPIPFDPRRVVVEVLETVHVNARVVAGLQRLAREGFRIALDDFVYAPEWDPCIDAADIIKLEVLNLSPSQVEQRVLNLKGRDVTVLAEKIDSHEQFELCKQLGFELFQGHFITKPAILKMQATSTSKIAVLQTLAALNNENADVAAVETAIAQDATLAMRVMKYVNSSANGLSIQIESLRQAISYLGMRNVRDVATLLLLNAIDQKPPVLMQTALIRATACKQLGQLIGAADDGAFFTVGLFSMLDVMVDQPLDEIVGNLPVSDRIKAALLRKEGQLGRCLQCVLDHERFSDVDFEPVRITASQVADAYLNAVASVERGEGLAGMVRGNKSSGIDALCFRTAQVAP